MEQKWWEEYSSTESIYSLDATSEQMDQAAKALERDGYATVALEDYFRGALGLLNRHFRQPPPPREVLLERILAFAHRERPHLPKSTIFRSGAQITPSDPPRCEWVDPKRILPTEPGEKSYIHHKVDEMADYAFRIATAVHNNPALLGRVLANEFRHPTPEQPQRLDLTSWDTPLGGIYRVNYNGNHRLTVFAALEAPCVLAEVHPTGPTYTTRAITVNEEEENMRIGLYRRLLHTYGIASIPRLGLSDYDDITSDWPILLASPEDAVRSLAATEALAGRRWTEQIGDLPRSWFTSPGFLETTSRGLFTKLTAYRDGWPSPEPAHQSWPNSLVLNWKTRRVPHDIPTSYGELPEASAMWPT